jgi:hypothetical protein
MLHSAELPPGLTHLAVEAGGLPWDVLRAADCRAYLLETMAAFGEPLRGSSEPMTAGDLPERIFRVLTAREYCYLGTARVAPYKEEILRWIARAIASRGPIRFYYDIGGGYHATLEPGSGTLDFDVGLAELMVLRQIRSFVSRVGQLYGPGASFTLVVDNLCAALINDIPVASTAAYCKALRAHFAPADFARVRAAHGARSAVALSAKQHENVERFLGRRCDRSEAAERAGLYAEVTTASERLLAERIEGVHMTQRASPGTICFRPFPGGDSRIQAGEVALLADGRRKVRPILLTSRNVGHYACVREAAPDFLPLSISHVTCARSRAG